MKVLDNVAMAMQCPMDRVASSTEFSRLFIYVNILGSVLFYLFSRSAFSHAPLPCIPSFDSACDAFSTESCIRMYMIEAHLRDPPTTQRSVHKLDSSAQIWNLTSAGWAEDQVRQAVDEGWQRVRRCVCLPRVVQDHWPQIAGWVYGC